MKDWNETMLHKTTETVFDYFNRLRGKESAPLRSEIDPSALKSVLPDLFFLEMAGDGALRFRLAGTRICVILGRELRGQPFTSIWHPSQRHKMKIAAETVLANRIPFEISVEASLENEESMDLEMLLLPLYSRAGQCDRIFGSLVAMQAGQLVRPLPRLLVPEGVSIVRPATTGPAEQAPTPAAPIGRLFNKVMHLRVFDGGRRD